MVQELQTVRRPWRLLRTVTSADTALTASQIDAIIRPTGGVEIRSQDINGLQFAAAGKGADGNNFNYKLYVGAVDEKGNQSGPLFLVCDGLATLGTMVLNQDPGPTPGSGLAASPSGYLWADTITATKRWIRDVRISDGQANNQAASFIADMWGMGYIFVEFPTLTTLTEAWMWMREA